MKARSKITNLNCEQVYKIWASEPDAIRVIDLRSQGEYNLAHIPGAIHIDPQLIHHELNQLGGRLAVLVASCDVEKSLFEQLHHRDDYVFLSDCEMWRTTNKPMEGSAMGPTKKVLEPTLKGGVPEVTVEQVASRILELKNNNALFIDVRRPDEFNNELGHISGALLYTLGDGLTRFLEQADRTREVVFICRSGARSETATIEGLKLGYKHCVNMVGGMLRWNELNLPIERQN